MGLDMYLEARKYVSQIDWTAVPHSTGEAVDFSQYKSEAFKALSSMFPEQLTQHSNAGSTVGINVAYWRKANQIHGWFVKNVQGGEDNCKAYPVDRDDLLNLLETINEVLAGDVEAAKQLLPVTAGFFFGNYDEDEGYDEFYYEDLRYTKKIIEDILDVIKDNPHEYDFYYQSSW